MKNKHSGRPEKSYKYIDPITKEPISAIEYHKRLRILKKNEENDTEEDIIYKLIEIRKIVDDLIKLSIKTQ